MARPLIDLTGEIYGDWLVLGRTTNDGLGRARWSCLCTCDATCAVRGDQLRAGRSSRCVSCAARLRLANRKDRANDPGPPANVST